jgi:predicted  nucleic acid-binding Zn-ribbon protein
MRAFRLILPCVVALAACDTKAKHELRTLAHTDSLRVDSLVSMKNELLNEVMASTQFVADLNTELAKLKARTASRKLNTAAAKESDVVPIKEQRAEIQARIRELVARLDSSESRVATLRARAATFAKRDSTITKQVDAYERTIADLRRQVEQQKAEYEATISRQSVQIATLNSRVDTLSGEKVVLTDSVDQLTAEKNTAYYVIGTKAELVSQGIIVEEGHKRFMFLGGRSLTAARSLDPSKFTKIDRLKDRVINFPAGNYRIISRQNAAYASPFSQHGSTVSGGLRIDQPEHFWEASPFLILVKG